VNSSYPHVNRSDERKGGVGKSFVTAVGIHVGERGYKVGFLIRNTGPSIPMGFGLRASGGYREFGIQPLKSIGGK
jgi:hypothetical protein